MKNLIKAILVLTILVVLFVKVYAPLMNEDNSTVNAAKTESLENLSTK
jgi:hypothetical protein